MLRFADSMRMPTYLVAFIVGDLEARPRSMVGRSPVRSGRTWEANLTRLVMRSARYSLGFSALITAFLIRATSSI